MKRFWTHATADPVSGGWAIRLDARAVRTPARAELIVPGEALAEAIVLEWADQGETIDPATMPMTGFANATIDRVLPALADFRGQVAAYSASDLFCYRASDPAELVAIQARSWDPMLDWAAQNFGVRFTVTDGIMPVEQQAATSARLRAAVEAVDPWLLAGAAVVTQIGGSLVGTLALLAGEIGAEALFDATTLDERWQAKLWGEDAKAAARLAHRKTELLSAARYCALVSEGKSR